MTRTQRRVHLAVWLTLWPLLVGSLIAAVAARRPLPIQDTPVDTVRLPEVSAEVAR